MHDYACTLLLQTIVVKCNLVFKKVQTLFTALVHLTIICFSNYQLLVVVFTVALPRVLPRIYRLGGKSRVPKATSFLGESVCSPEMVEMNLR